MQPPQLPLMPPVSIPPGMSGSQSWDVLLYLGGSVLVGVLGYLGVRSTRVAPLQTALNDAFRSLTAELQTERASFIVRISELERKCATNMEEKLALEGKIRNLEQTRDSLIALLKRSGVEVPGEHKRTRRPKTSEGTKPS